ncbi:Rieske (2Fe-2S) protein [Bradyrhizobium sp. 169]|uniref:Rieske (2Fe-2S) protein n=1 Tax=Bradyrhizobium sp. 169 TaxID=2782640 RepID=UPI001FFBB9CC|nr:Rieske (2Fe-2S) protein [Bradyrhizobium sp. 169]
MSKKYEVCYTDEIPAGSRLIVDIAGRSVGLFNINNEYFAVRNSCPHRGAPLCRGLVDGIVTGDTPGQFESEREGEIIRCPWHGWEFDIKTGQSVFNPHKVWVRSYPISIEQNKSVPAKAGSAEQDPSIETYPVSLEAVSDSPRSKLYIHL